MFFPLLVSRNSCTNPALLPVIFRVEHKVKQTSVLCVLFHSFVWGYWQTRILAVPVCSGSQQEEMWQPQLGCSSAQGLSPSLVCKSFSSEEQLCWIKRCRCPYNTQSIVGRCAWGRTLNHICHLWNKWQVLTFVFNPLEKQGQVECRNEEHWNRLCLHLQIQFWC